MKKTISKALSIVLVIMLTGLMCITASAAEFPGSGTKNDPYTISSAAELTAFSKAVSDGNTFSGKFITVTKDIEADSSFNPIGTEATPFKGTFNGNGNELSGFDFETDYSGLFAFTDGAVISDVSVSGYFYATNYAGAIVAYAKNTTIENCTIDAYIDAVTYAGGIAGRIDSGKIASCSTDNTSSIGSSTTEYCGGIAGYSAAEISDCTNKAYTEGKKNVGGIAGYSAADIISCTNNATIKAVSTNLGGIAGFTKAAVKYCKNTGRIASSEKAGNVGGIAGAADNAEITECMNNGAVVAANNYAGGIAGYVTNTDITDCIATANVSNTGEYAGGIFGFALKGTVTRCVFTALVTNAKNSTKGAVGAISQGTVSQCYYNNSRADKAVYAGTETDSTGLTAADFKDEAKLTALDFDKTWSIYTLHAAYPLLDNIPFHAFRNPVSTEASCTEDGRFTGTCTTCNETVVIITPAFGHSHMIVASQAATCTAAGYKDVLCTVCSETDTITLPATGHTDADANNICDVCNADITEKQPEQEKSFLQKVADFFNSIIEWIRNLFAGIFG